jgi:hypothetical protein
MAHIHVMHGDEARPITYFPFGPMEYRGKPSRKRLRIWPRPPPSPDAPAGASFSFSERCVIIRFLIGAISSAQLQVNCAVRGGPNRSRYG